MQVLVAFSYVIWTFSYSFLMFVFARFLLGITKGSVTISQAIMTDLSTPERRGKALVRSHSEVCQLFISSNFS